jgi:hypothetical protein
MKKRLSHFAYNERSRSGWTLSIPPAHTLESNPIDHKKTVTYVPGTFVTLVSGPYTLLSKGGSDRSREKNSQIRFAKGLQFSVPFFEKEGEGRFGQSHGFVPKNISLASLAMSL